MRRRPCRPPKRCRRARTLLMIYFSRDSSMSEPLQLARPAPARRPRRGPRHLTPGSRARSLWSLLYGLLQCRPFVLTRRRSGDLVSPLLLLPLVTLRVLAAVRAGRAARRCLFCSGSSPCFFIDSLPGSRSAGASRRARRRYALRARWRLAFLGLSGPCWVFAGARPRREQALTVLRA